MSQIAVPRRQNHTFAGVFLGVAFVILVICTVAAVTGCQTETKTTFDGDRSLFFDEKNRLVYHETTGQTTRAIAPGATSQPTSSEAGWNGVSSSASGRQLKAIGAYVGEKREMIYGIAGISIFVLGIVLAWWTKEFVLGGCVSAAGILICAMPVLLEAFEPFAPAIVMLVIACFGIGVAWSFAKFLSRRKEDRHALASFLNLNSTGRSDQATAALKESPTAREIAKERKLARLKAAAAEPPAVPITAAP